MSPGSNTTCGISGRASPARRKSRRGGSHARFTRLWRDATPLCQSPYAEPSRETAKNKKKKSPVDFAAGGGGATCYKAVSRSPAVRRSPADAAKPRQTPGKASPRDAQRAFQNRCAPACCPFSCSRSFRTAPHRSIQRESVASRGKMSLLFFRTLRP